MGARVCLSADDPKNLWGFCPSYIVAIIFTSVFGAVTLAHVCQGFYYKKRFCWVVSMAAAWETAGLVFRVLASTDQTSDTDQTASNMLVLLAPIWLNAFVYMVFGRVVYYWLPEKKFVKIKARTITKWFVWLDVFIFCVQAGGGSLLDNTDPHTAKIGLDVYQAGLGLQQAVVVMFWVMLLFFMRDVRDHGKARAKSSTALIWTMAIVLLLITVRIIFRFLEFNAGTEGPIPTHEVYFYLLEATPMALAISLFVIFHPGRYLVGEESEFSKLIVKKGPRRWWCMGLRKKTKIDPDFEMDLQDRVKRSSNQSYLDPLVASPQPKPSSHRHHSHRHHRRDNEQVRYN